MLSLCFQQSSSVLLFQHGFIPELSLLFERGHLAFHLSHLILYLAPLQMFYLVPLQILYCRHRDVILHSVQAARSHGMQDDRRGTFKNNLFICRNFITKMLTKYELFQSPFCFQPHHFQGFFLLLLIVVICVCMHTAFSSPRFG